MKKILRKLIFFRIFNNFKFKLILIFFIIIIIAFLGYNFFNFVKAANLNFTESFDNTTYKDSLHTSAHWQADGQVYLTKEWVTANGVKSFNDNVSADNDTSAYPLIFVDNRNQPYILWEQYMSPPGSFDIFMTHANLQTLQWEKMDGTQGIDNISNSAANSLVDRVAFNSYGHPYIVWQENNNEIYFSRWDGIKWATMAGAAGWENISNTATVSQLPRIVLDNNNRPCVVWDESVAVGNNEIVFTHWNGSKWATMTNANGWENISNTAGESNFPRILISTNNRPYITWRDNTTGNNEIYFTRWDGFKWATMAGAAGNENISNTLIGNSTYDRLYDTNFQLDFNNQPYVVWSDDTDGGYDIYFTHWDGVNWATMASVPGTEVLSNPVLASLRPQLMIDQNNFPVVVWISVSNLYFSHWDGSNWVKLDGTAGYELVSAGPSGFPSLTIDQSNIYYISWLNTVTPNKSILVARSTGPAWTKMDGSPGFDNVTTYLNSNRSQMAIAPNGNLYLVWQAGAGGGNSDIWFTYWDNALQSWRSFKEGTEGNTELIGEQHYYVNYLDLKVDNANNPFLVWADDCEIGGTLTFDVCFTHWDPIDSRWEDMAGNPGNEILSDFYLTNTALGTIINDFDSLNNPVVVFNAYKTGAPADIYFTKWTAAGPGICGGPAACWTNMVGTVAGYENVTNNIPAVDYTFMYKYNLAIDALDNPYLFWYQRNPVLGGSSDVYFTKWTANPVTCAPNLACWTNMAGTVAGIENISNNFSLSTDSQLLLDSLDLPYLVWADDNGVAGKREIYFTKWTANPVTCAPNLACWTNMAGTVAGNENITNSPAVDSLLNTGSSFKLDSANNPYLIWYEGGNIVFTHWNGAAWKGMTNLSLYDTISTSGNNPSLELDSINNPHVAWDIFSGSNREIYYSQWDQIDARWEKANGLAGSENISNTSGSSTSAKLFIDSTDKAVAFWKDDTEATWSSAADYFFSRWDGTSWVNMKNEPGYTNITHNLSDDTTNFAVTKDSFDDFYLFYGRMPYGYQFPYFTRTGIPTNYYRTAQSTDINSSSDRVSTATITSVSQVMPVGTDIKYFLSNDNGFNWFNVAVGVPFSFPVENSALKWRASLKTTNPSLNPLINDLVIDYTTVPISGVVIGTIPSSPNILTCQAQSPDTIRWNFEDSATDETGFRLYGQDQLILNTGDEITTDLSYLDETNLSPNTQYIDRYVTAFNGAGESSPSDLASCYTLANTPLELEIIDTTTNSITLKINPGDNNPPNTNYAIKELNSNQYLNPDGTFSFTENWQDYAGWGGDNGVIISGEPLPVNELLNNNNNYNFNQNVNAQFKISLTTGQTYNFAAKAINGDGIETGFSATTSGSTAGGGAVPAQVPQIIATKGVGVNLALNDNFKKTIVNIANAYDDLVIKQTTPQERLLFFLQEFAIFLGLVLILLLVFLILGIHGAIKNLDKKIPLVQKLKIIWQILLNEPALVFIINALKDQSGTYQISYEKHRRLQNFSRRNFNRVVGLIIIDTFILILVLIGLNHKGRAQLAPYNQNGQEINVGDKLNYVVEITNQGTLIAGEVVVIDTLDNNLSYLTNSAKIMKAGQETTAGINVNGNSLSFNIGDLDIGQSGAIYLTGQVKSGTEGQTIRNVGQVSGLNFASLLTNATNNRVAEEEVPPEETPPVETPLETPPAETPPTETPPVTTPPSVTPPTPPVTPPATPPKPPLISMITESKPVKYLQEAVVDNPQVENVSQNVITPILLILAIVNTVPAVLALAISILPYLHLLFIEPLLLLFRKKRRKWGIVYDALNKLPVGLAVVRLYSKKDNKLVQTKVTDKEGRYLMIVKEPGRYYLSVTKPDYIFPTKYLAIEKQDFKYLDLYHGEEIEVMQKEGVVTANIPLDPREKKRLTEKEAIRSYLVKNLRLLVSYIGLILSILIILIYPTVITIGSLVIHIILFLLFRRLVVPPKPKSWGIVYDDKTKASLTHAIVRIFETRFNKLLETQVTDGKGRYAFLVGKNEYQLLAEKQGYQPKEIKQIDLIKKEEIVNLDVGLSKI